MPVIEFAPNTICSSAGGKTETRSTGLMAAALPSGYNFDYTIP